MGTTLLIKSDVVVILSVPLTLGCIPINLYPLITLEIFIAFRTYFKCREDSLPEKKNSLLTNPDPRWGLCWTQNIASAENSHQNVNTTFQMGTYNFVFNYWIGLTVTKHIAKCQGGEVSSKSISPAARKWDHRDTKASKVSLRMAKQRIGNCLCVCVYLVWSFMRCLKPFTKTCQSLGRPQARNERNERFSTLTLSILRYQMGPLFSGLQQLINRQQGNHSEEAKLSHAKCFILHDIFMMWLSHRFAVLILQAYVFTN